MRQQTLTDFDPSYASLVSDVLPDRSQAVFFKDIWGATYQGEFYTANEEIEEPYFEVDGMVFLLEETESWHPIRVDI